MLSVNKLVPRGRGLAGALLKRAASMDLDWDTRQKSRFEATDSAGRRLGVFLPRGSVVRGGDVLVAEDGSLVVVRAAPQPVLVVRQGPQGAPGDLLRAAYHLGNRHVAVELKTDHLKFEPDHVLGEMLQRLHLTVSQALAPFEPEGGAYASHGGDAHSHDHGHGHAHAHDSPPAAAPAGGKLLNVPVAAAPVAHVHGPGCRHDHDHGH
jgi:urease accessory protein